MHSVHKMRPIARGRVSWSVCLLATSVSRVKTADLIKMPTGEGTIGWTQGTM